MSDLPWLRLYTDTIDNEKLRLLSFEDRWHYIAFLCLKQQGILDSKDKLKERMIAVKLGVQIRELEEIKRRLLEVDLLDSNYQPIGWMKHQFVSDSSTNRVRKYRENKKNKACNVTETLPKRKCNAIDTDTEQIQIQKKKKKKIVKENKFSSQDDEFARYMFSKIQDINPSAKHPNFDKWANEIRLMREIDNRIEVDIKSVFDWANSDPFWRGNILSPIKLRKQFDQLLIKSQAENKNERQGSTTRVTNNLKRLFEEQA